MTLSVSAKERAALTLRMMILVKASGHIGGGGRSRCRGDPPSGVRAWDVEKGGGGGGRPKQIRET
jgi:hypothetical protein